MNLNANAFFFPHAITKLIPVDDLGIMESGMKNI